MTCIKDEMYLFGHKILADSRPGLGASCVIISCSGERPSEFGDLASGLVDGDDVTRLDLFLDHGFNHLGALDSKSLRI